MEQEELEELKFIEDNYDKWIDDDPSDNDII